MNSNGARGPIGSPVSGSISGSSNTLMTLSTIDCCFVVPATKIAFIM